MPATRLAIAAALLLGTAPVLADSFTATVRDVTGSGIVTFDDNSQLMLDPATPVEGGPVTQGAKVSVDFESSENGYDKINRIRVEPGQ